MKYSGIAASSSAVAEQRQVYRLPADLGADAAGGFQRVQKGVLQKRRIAGQGVPGVGGQLRNARNDADDGFRHRGGLLQNARFGELPSKTMNLHEYQAKQILRSGNINTPRGIAAASADAAVNAAGELEGVAWMVKAQIHAGGRGKAGGVKLVRSLDAVRDTAASLLGRHLITMQNAPDGQPVRQVLIEETMSIARELYLSMLVDRSEERVVVVASSAGGMEIEEVAHASPEKILREVCDPLLGLVDYQARNLAFALGLAGAQIGAFTKLLKGLYQLFRDNDLSLLEINPLVVTEMGTLVALDCKMSVDDNAMYRQRQLAENRDWTQDDPKEAEAACQRAQLRRPRRQHRLYRERRWLAMATMDAVKLFGRPAGQLPRHWRRRQRQVGRRGSAHHPGQSARAGA